MTGPDISAQRADPFAIDAEPDLSSFKPRPAQRTPAVARATIRQVSEENNFPSREATAPGQNRNHSAGGSPDAMSRSTSRPNRRRSIV